MNVSNEDLYFGLLAVHIELKGIMEVLLRDKMSREELEKLLENMDGLFQRVEE